VCCVIFHPDNEREIGYPIATQFPLISPPFDLRRDLVIDHSDHMWLFYFTQERFREKYCELKFGIPNTRYFGDKVVLKKYGYRFVYEQDLQP